MSRILFTIIFMLGAATIVWIGAGFVGAHALALTVTLIIAAVYGMGAFEMLQFRRATSTLSSALVSIPDNLVRLEDWLNRIHPSLQNAVRLRIEGERVGLPGPALTPYLVGLLVMLGMLGTFLGMVATLNGTVFALESTPDLQAIRSGLAAPIKGLGLAFGTSVAGVAASAMLGLISALSRRERLHAAQVLDAKIATVLRGFSLAYHRQETFKSLQMQAHSLPAVVDKLQAMAVQMERMSNQLNERLATNQERFHSSVQGVFADLAQSVEKSLKESLAEGGRSAGESMKPIVEGAMAGIAREAQNTHATLASVVQTQLEGFTERLSHTTTAVANTWKEALAKQTSWDQKRFDVWVGALESIAANLNHEWRQSADNTLLQQQNVASAFAATAQEIAQNTQSSSSQMLNEIAHLLSASEELMRSRMASEERWLKAHSERMDQLGSQLRAELSSLRNEEAARGSAAVERLVDLQSAVARHLTTLGSALEAPMTRLIETAAEAPRAAAEVLAQLRQEISNNLVRDNALLDERQRIMQGLDTLLKSLNQATAEQRKAIETLVNSSADTLSSVGTLFTNRVEVETSKLADMAAQVTGSTVEVASLSEAFGYAVQLFSESNDKLIENLTRIEAAMGSATTRSDEQLAYYVAQAREIIDLSMMSQKEIFEELRQLSSQNIRVPAEEK